MYLSKPANLFNNEFIGLINEEESKGKNLGLAKKPLSLKEEGFLFNVCPIAFGPDIYKNNFLNKCFNVTFSISSVNNSLFNTVYTINKNQEEIVNTFKYVVKDIFKQNTNNVYYRLGVVQPPIMRIIRKKL